ncbi:MAG: NUDIX hydrolase [Aeriscardovia sp.]|nr:NUDIX hydrolase [Aeriscardovia sp.]
MAYTYKYPRPAVTADCIVITREAEPKVLLIQRGNEPFKGGWAFPGGFMNMDETTEQCAIRELEEETGLRVSNIQQIGAYSKIDRDPRGRTVTVAYLAIVDEPIFVTGQDDAAKAEWWHCRTCHIWHLTTMTSCRMQSESTKCAFHKACETLIADNIGIFS